ncbi:hypothetical protein ACKKBG_A14505 [Auxenochlorella protothecoides x Auxenochlorella symbiontica]
MTAGSSSGRSRALLAAFFLLVATQAQGTPESGDSLPWYQQELPDKLLGTRVEERQNAAHVFSIWFHHSRFYAIHDPSDATCLASARTDFPFSPSLPLIKLPVASVARAVGNLATAWLPGLTLVLDHPTPAAAEKLGTWVEALAAAWSHLSEGPAAAPATVLIPGLERGAAAHTPGVWALLSMVMGRDRAGPLPTLLFFDDLARLPPGLWLGLEHVVALRPPANASHQSLGAFTAPQHAASFRAALLSLPDVAIPTSAPNGTITLLMDADSPGVRWRHISEARGAVSIAGMASLLRALREAGAAHGVPARPYSPSQGTPLSAMVSALGGTRVLLGRAGPELAAAAALLPPGALVYELRAAVQGPPRGPGAAARGATRRLAASRGDLAWAARAAPGPGATLWADAADARYARWLPEECSSAPCLEANARAALVVDADAVRRDLAAALPILSVVGGDPADAVARLESVLPRPPDAPAPPPGTTGLWWDLD